MAELNKIKNVNLADLDAGHTLEDALNEKQTDKTPQATDKTPQVTDKMADPVGRNYKIDANITVKEIQDFLLGHAYHQPLTYLLVLAGIAYGVFMYFQMKNVVVSILIIGLVIIFYPITLISRARKVKNRNKTFSETFHYMFDEVGCHLQLSHEAIDIEWKYFHNILKTGSVVIIYTNKINGYIVPVKDMGDKKEEIIAFLTEKIKK